MANGNVYRRDDRQRSWVGFEPAGGEVASDLEFGNVSDDGDLEAIGKGRILWDSGKRHGGRAARIGETGAAACVEQGIVHAFTHQKEPGDATLCHEGGGVGDQLVGVGDGARRVDPVEN
jgi:hypothetical protein